jgi:dihydroflavonol-4-reductase
VRSAEREADVRNIVERAGLTPGDNLTFAVADLTSDPDRPEPIDGSAFVLHVASPYPPDEPADEDELIVPARDGTLRVLRAARDDVGVKRVVLTSSFVAIGCGHRNVDREFTEDDWTDLDGEGITAYVKSKVLAERAAWDFAENEAGRIELSAVNPTATFGPTLSDDISASLATILTLLMAGEEPVLMANLRFPVADVRDVADIHLRAMTHTAAAGQRFIACCDWRPHHDATGRADPTCLGERRLRHRITCPRWDRATVQPKGQGRPPLGICVVSENQ